MHVVATGRSSGDLVPDDDATDHEVRRRQLVDLPWAWAEQVHGADVAVVREPGPVGEADALVTDVDGLVVSVRTADCAPVALVGREGVVAAVHAGWPGLESGVIQSAAGVMAGLDAGEVRAVLGPCIHPGCYEFGDDLLARLTDRYGSEVATLSAEGRPALDIPATVDAALAEVGVGPAARLGPGCTSCHADLLWSHRARGDSARQGIAVWRRSR